MTIDKVVLAMHAALLSKYGDAGMARIQKALGMPGETSVVAGTDGQGFTVDA